MRNSTEQEAFWAGDFGNDYIARNPCSQLRLADDLMLWSTILRKMSTPPRTILELGANIGCNLRALAILLNSRTSFCAVEINPSAVDQLKKWGGATVFQKSLLDFSPEPTRTWDLVFTSGVLIHLAPSDLQAAYSTIYSCSHKYILLNEYFNVTPVEIEYHGYQEKLYKRDFAGEMLDKFPDLKLVDYAFIWGRDPRLNGTDSMTWFLLSK